MWERGWSTLNAKDWGKGILPGTVNKQAGQAREAPVGVGARTQQPGAGKLVRVAEGENSTGKEGRPTSHVSCKQTCRPEEVGAVSPSPVCLERGKLVAVAHTQDSE
jgi:hypothetical protein